MWINFVLGIVFTFACMTTNAKKPTLEDFLSYFPEISLPVSLTEESAVSFSKLNKALPLSLIEEFIDTVETDYDEFTEFIPCLQFPVSNYIVAFVYWKATLLSYDYILMVIDAKSGGVIAKKVIGGTKVVENRIFRSASMISEELEIEVIVNEYEDKIENIYPLSTVKFHMEIMSEGNIISEKEKKEVQGNNSEK